MSAVASLALPGTPEYAAATEVFNLAGPLHPAAAVTARTVADVAAAIGAAKASGLGVRVHSTGHASASVPAVDGSLLIRTALDGDVEIDTARRIARVPAGACWGDVVRAAAPHGLTAPHGSSAHVGVVGYLLRGGLSFYGRALGLGVNSVRAVELVTADGSLVRADAEADPDLFWALRGGGGGLGVVTAVEVALYPATTVVTGAAYWPGAHAPALLRAWREWTLTAPDAVTTSARIMNLPEHPQVPPPLAGRTTLVVDGAVLAEGDDREGAERIAAELLGPLREIAVPVVDSWETTTPEAVLLAHGDPDDPVPIIGDHMLLSELGTEGVDAFLGVAGEGSGSGLIAAGLRQLGGAFAVPDPSGGALSAVPARYSYAGSAAPFVLTPAQIRAQLARVRAALTPWDTGLTVPSFVEDRDQPQRHMSARDAARAAAVRARVDPEGLFAGDVAP
ncbi:FAD-binding oxidoreductase [Actinocorallia sp. A-T 12471]|uniref:FAD-binding oxidoreductase n=1 Tax=Actinocorallia sp. A-T 12471 TaxID=3089813 RepID=UPI0029CBC37A|nr:FAD-binding protein [Actinocorallia sp. A-T 12471]MDX6741624.1 FAD-binding protein [Actinocorallia sp. A-T 12471]